MKRRRAAQKHVDPKYANRLSLFNFLGHVIDTFYPVAPPPTTPRQADVEGDFVSVSLPEHRAPRGSELAEPDQPLAAPRSVHEPSQHHLRGVALGVRRSPSPVPPVSVPVPSRNSPPPLAGQAADYSLSSVVFPPRAGAAPIAPVPVPAAALGGGHSRTSRSHK